MESTGMLTSEQMEALGPEGRIAFAEALSKIKNARRRSALCPVSGMGRDMCDWDECDRDACAWYIEGDESTGWGCAVTFLCMIGEN